MSMGGHVSSVLWCENGNVGLSVPRWCLYALRTWLRAAVRNIAKAAMVNVCCHWRLCGRHVAVEFVGSSLLFCA